jgi:two-component system cell cycle response regulator
VDRFTTVNDTFGHAAGDAGLAEIAARLRDNLRPGDMVARFGGEEFLIAMRDSDDAAASAAADRLRRTVAASPVPVASLRSELTATVSIGVAIADPREPAATVAALIDRADQALLAAKAEGRNQVALARPAA